jgi:hypothetical protein
VPSLHLSTKTIQFLEESMWLSIARRDRQSATDAGVSRVLLLAMAMAMGCGVATTANAADDDKAKTRVEAPSTATVDSKTTVVQPSARSDAETSDANPDARDRRRARRLREHMYMGDDDFDSFNEALHTAPWVVGLAFLVAGSILLTPVFLLVGIIWYKLRKTRLQNEAMLKLAERGAMTPAQAADAVMAGATPEAAAAASSASLFQQAVITRRRAVWSDLRKGVILTAIGSAFVFYWLVEHGVASWVGLVLVFLGIGYILLWSFEDRHLKRREGGAGVDVDAGKN